MALRDQAARLLRKKFKNPWMLQQELYAIFASEPDFAVPISQVSGPNMDGYTFPTIPPELPFYFPFFDFDTLLPEVIEPEMTDPGGFGLGIVRNEMKKLQRWFRSSLLGRVVRNITPDSELVEIDFDLYECLLYPNGPDHDPGLNGKTVAVKQMTPGVVIEDGQWVVPILRELLLEFRKHQTFVNDQLTQEWMEIEIKEQHHQMGFTPPGGGGGLLGRIVSGEGDTYQVRLYPDGPTEDEELVAELEVVEVKQLTIDPEDSIPPDTWWAPILQFTDEEGLPYYRMQMPVWL